MRHILSIIALILLFPFCNFGKDNHHIVSNKGAWCWFADPRAIHHKSDDGKINKTYIGYIDVHGNIKAMQYDFNKNINEEVLIRSYFQPDDHNNPTFLVLPDDRVMIFYSRHTDEACFYYRVTQTPGDITTLGDEMKIATSHNTTYPSPFILADDPEHIYLCWRGIKWHPTIAKLSLPNINDEVEFTWGPHQIVQSTGARPYAKYTSNGKDKILLTYTTGHPDNEATNFLYYNYIDVNDLKLKEINGKTISNIAEAPFQINKSDDFVAKYPTTIVDNPNMRDWVWQVAMDKQDNPVIAMVRINDDKTDHTYYYAKWDGEQWRKTFLADAGGHFHQTPNHEMCYSGGMAIDPDNSNIIYCSVPVNGAHGKIYELLKVELNNKGDVKTEKFITSNSKYNNVRPYVIENSKGTPLRLIWMHGDYYDWIVSSRWPEGFPTAIYSDFSGFTTKKKSIFKRKKEVNNANSKYEIITIIDLESHNYSGEIYQLDLFTYYLDRETLKLEIRFNNKVYKSSNVIGNSDIWQKMNRGTGGHWYPITKLPSFELKLTYQEGVLTTYINGIIDQRVKVGEWPNIKNIINQHK